MGEAVVWQFETAPTRWRKAMARCRAKPSKKHLAILGRKTANVIFLAEARGKDSMPALRLSKALDDGCNFETAAALAPEVELLVTQLEIVAWVESLDRWYATGANRRMREKGRSADQDNAIRGVGEREAFDKDDVWCHHIACLVRHQTLDYSAIVDRCRAKSGEETGTRQRLAWMTAKGYFDPRRKRMPYRLSAKGETVYFPARRAVAE